MVSNNGEFKPIGQSNVSVVFTQTLQWGDENGRVHPGDVLQIRFKDAVSLDYNGFAKIILSEDDVKKVQYDSNYSVLRNINHLEHSNLEDFVKKQRAAYKKKCDQKKRDIQMSEELQKEKSQTYVKQLESDVKSLKERIERMESKG